MSLQCRPLCGCSDIPPFVPQVGQALQPVVLRAPIGPTSLEVDVASQAKLKLEEINAKVTNGVSGYEEESTPKKASIAEFLDRDSQAKGLLTENGTDPSMNLRHVTVLELAAIISDKDFWADVKEFLTKLQASQERIERNFHAIVEHVDMSEISSMRHSPTMRNVEFGKDTTRSSVFSPNDEREFEDIEGFTTQPSFSKPTYSMLPLPSLSKPKRQTVFTDFTARLEKLAGMRASMELKNPHMDDHAGHEFIHDHGCSSVPVFSPYGRFISLVWNPLFFFCILWALSMAPFDMVFHWWEQPTIYKVVGKTVDVFFILDLFLHFNTAIEHDGHLVSDRKAIAIHYAQTWLALDIVANVPYDWFISGEGKSRKFLKIAKLPKLLRAVRLLRTLKKHARYVGIPLSLAATFLAAHWFSCAWVWAMQGGCDEDTDECPDVLNTYIEALSISMASFTGADSWTRLLWPPSSSYLSTGRLPWESFEIHQELMAISGSFAGIFVCGVVFCNISKAFRTSDVQRARANMLEDRRAEMKQKKLPPNLKTKIEITYRYLWNIGSQKDALIQDTNLSLDLRRNIAFHVYGDALRSVPIFKALDERYLKCLAEKVSMKLYSPGDLLIMKGEIGTELFVIHSGMAQPISDDGLALTAEGLREGAFFGEICFLSPGSRRKASVICVEICRAMVLTLGVFKELNLEDTLADIRAHARQNLESVKREEKLSKKEEKMSVNKQKKKASPSFPSDS